MTISIEITIDGEEQDVREIADALPVIIEDLRISALEHIRERKNDEIVVRAAYALMRAMDTDKKSDVGPEARK